MAAPAGNQNAAKARIFRDAIKWALVHYDEEDPCSKMIEGPEKALRLMCLAQVRKAADEGDIHSFRELADRVDGRPVQAIVGDDEHPPVQVVGRIKLIKPE